MSRTLRPQQFLARVAIGLAGLRIHVDDRTGLPVVDEDRVLAGLEDLAVVRLGCAQRGGGGGALELGVDPHGEDPQHRLDERRVLECRRETTAIRPSGVAGGVVQRVPRVALHAELAEVPSSGNSSGRRVGYRR